MAVYKGYICSFFKKVEYPCHVFVVLQVTSWIFTPTTKTDLIMVLKYK